MNRLWFSKRFLGNSTQFFKLVFEVELNKLLNIEPTRARNDHMKEIQRNFIENIEFWFEMTAVRNTFTQQPFQTKRNDVIFNQIYF